MRANVEQGLRGDYGMLSAVVIPTFCDTLKCVCENWRSIPTLPTGIPMVYPQNSKTIAGEDYMTEELYRVGREIAALSGKPISDQALEEYFTVYEQGRILQRQFTELVALHPNIISPCVRHYVLKAGYLMERKEYNDTLSEVNEWLSNQPQVAFSGIRLVASGIMLEPDLILTMLEDYGISIVADDLAQESRQFRVPASCANESIYRKIARRYTGQSGDPLIYDADRLREDNLIHMVNHYQADGVLLAMMKFCDPEEFDYPIMKTRLEEAGVPLLCLETELAGPSVESLRTRVEGFLEILEQRRGNRYGN